MKKKSHKKKNKSVVAPHDKLFKTSMADKVIAREFFERYLPKELLCLIDLNGLDLRPNSYINPLLESKESDVLYRTTIAGVPVYLYLLCEHQSTPQKLMPLRLLEYKTSIWREHLKQEGTPKNGKLPLIIPLVFYAGEKAWTEPLDLKELIDAPSGLIEQVLYQPARLIDTYHLKDPELEDGSLVGTMAYFLKHARYRDAYVYIRHIFKQLQVLERTAHQNFVISALRHAIIESNTEHIEALVQFIQEHFSPVVGAEIMTIAQKLRDEGKQYWTQQGMQQGMQQGESTMLERQLTSRFGKVPSHYVEKMRTASSETLLAWGQRFVNAQTIEEVFSSKKH